MKLLMKTLDGKKKPRILIITNEHLYSNLALNRLIDSYNKQIVAIIEPDFLVFGKNYIQSIFFLFKKSIFPFCLYKFFEEKVYKLKTKFGIGKLRSFKFYSKKYGIAMFKTTDINGIKTESLIRRLKPDVIYSVAFPQKVRKNILKIPKYAINFHDSLLPSYRGLCAYFWITANDEKRSGISFHIMDEDMDTGNLITQKSFQIGKNDTMQRIYFKSSRLAGETILEVQGMVERNAIKTYLQKKRGFYNSWPNKSGYKKFVKNRKRFFKFRELWDSI